MKTLARFTVPFVMFAICTGVWSCASRPVPAPAVPVKDQEHANAGDVQPCDWDVRGGPTDPVYEVLGVDPTSAAWMICKPSFQPESCVSIVAAASGAQGQTSWTLRVTLASDSVRRALREGRTPVIVTHVVPLSDHDATVLADAWESVVRRARYPKPEYTSMDGTRYERVRLSADGVAYVFGASRFYGRADNPTPGLSLDLATLGSKLTEVALSPPESRSDLLAGCLWRAAEMQRKAETLPW